MIARLKDRSRPAAWITTLEGFSGHLANASSQRLSAKRIFGDKRALRDYFLPGLHAETSGFWSALSRTTLSCVGATSAPFDRVQESCMKFSTRPLASGLIAAAALLSACGGGGTPTGGTLRLAMTDAPTCGFDRVDVTVQKVRVHQSSSAADADAGWSEVVLSPPQRIDLLSLTNGVLTELGQTMLPAGKYTQLRLVLGANDASNPLANSITPTGGAETALTTPSATQSGLKMNVDIEVAANKLADFILDFDACKSFVKVGQSNTWILKPVITVVPRLSDAGSRGRLRVDAARGRQHHCLRAAERDTGQSTPPDSTGSSCSTPFQPATTTWSSAPQASVWQPSRASGRR
jgi:hypothetical protein